MDKSVTFLLLLQLFLIALNAVFACAEIAIISMNDAKLAKLASEGDKRALRLARLTSQPARFLATIQVAITVSGFLGSAFAADNFSDMLVEGLINLGLNVPRATLDTVAVIVITLVLSYFTLVFGELVPKQVAMRKAESLALGISGLISGIAAVFRPVVWFLTVSTNAVLRLMGIDPNARDDEVSEEEIRMMVDVGSERGTIDPQEKELIQNVFEFDDLTAGEIAVHRMDVDVLWLEDDEEQWDAAIREGEHSMYPVCGETADDVVGILSTKRYFRLDSIKRERVMAAAVEQPYFVPQNVKADVLFRNMKAKHSFFAVVLDGHGGVAGIVTLSDLLEQLVGDFEPKSGEESSYWEISRLENEDGPVWTIGGGVSLDEVNRQLDVSLDDSDCDSFGAYVFGIIGAVPDDGCRMELQADGLSIKLEELDDHRLLRAKVKKLNNKDDTDNIINE